MKYLISSFAVFLFVSCNSKKIPVEQLSKLEWGMSGEETKRIINQIPKKILSGSSGNIETMLYDGDSSLRFESIRSTITFYEFGVDGFEPTNNLFNIKINFNENALDTEVFPYFMLKLGKPDYHYRTYSEEQLEQVGTQIISNKISQEAGGNQISDIKWPEFKQARYAIWYKDGTCISLSYEPKMLVSNLRLALFQDQRKLHFNEQIEIYNKLRSQNKIENI